MTKSIICSFIPEIPSDVLSKLGFKAKLYDAYYEFEGSNRSLKIESENSISFEDPCCIWTVEDYGLNLRYNCTIKHPELLFADEDLIKSDDVLAVSALIFSQESRQRRITNKEITLIKSGDKEINFEFTAEIPPGILRDFAMFEILLHIKYNSDPESPAIPGSVLSTLFKQPISFSGEASDFPIEVVSSNDNFLWNLSVNFENNPCKERFDECVLLTLNEKHPDYKALQLDTLDVNNPIFKEILAEAIYLIIAKVKNTEYFSNIQSQSNLEPGSLGQAAAYFIQAFDLTLDDPIETMSQIHKKVESVMKE